ncbi:MAG: hypothetical protein VXY77_00675 [Pseudomonadota bacterium]|nr:hypothetical protein [Pseudomonadota bacterium]
MNLFDIKTTNCNFLKQLTNILENGIDSYVQANEGVPSIQQALDNYRSKHTRKDFFLAPELMPVSCWSEAMQRLPGGPRDQLCIDAIGDLDNQSGENMENLIIFRNAFNALTVLSRFVALKESQPDVDMTSQIHNMIGELLDALRLLDQKGVMSFPEFLDDQSLELFFTAGSFVDVKVQDDIPSEPENSRCAIL